MKNCPNCNQPVSDTAKFCLECGFNIKKYEEELQQEHFHYESSTNISELLNETSPNTPVPNLDAFDYSELINAADEKVIQSTLSAFEYEQMSNGKYLIKKLKNSSELIIVVPDCVQVIGDNAFAESSIIDVTLPEGVVKIGNRAFEGCYDLEKINLPSSLRIIGDEAFLGCTNLNLEQPQGVRCGKDAFKDTLYFINKEKERQHKEAEAKAKVEAEAKAKAEAAAKAKAEAEAKAKAEAEVKAKAEAEVKAKAEAEAKAKAEAEAKAKAEAAAKAKAEAEVKAKAKAAQAEIDRKLAEEGNYTFGLKFNHVPKENAYYVCGYEGESRHVTIPSEYNKLPVAGIQDKAFDDCRYIKSVELPQSLKIIGNRAFYWCKSLTSIEIPDSVTSIGFDAFDDCASLEFNEYGGAYYLGSKDNPYFALIEAVDREIEFCDIHNDTKIIASGAFANYNSIEEIVIPNSVTNIGDRIFYGVYVRLKTLTLPFVPSGRYEGNELISGLRTLAEEDNGRNHGVPISLWNVRITGGDSIGDYAFYGCKYLKNIILPEGITRIGKHAFNGCGIESIKIPKSVTSIDISAFNNCNNLKTIEVSSKLDPDIIKELKKKFKVIKYDSFLGRFFH